MTEEVKADKPMTEEVKADKPKRGRPSSSSKVKNASSQKFQFGTFVCAAGEEIELTAEQEKNVELQKRLLRQVEIGRMELK